MNQNLKLRRRRERAGLPSHLGINSTRPSSRLRSQTILRAASVTRGIVASVMHPTMRYRGPGRAPETKITRALNALRRVFSQ